MSIGLLLAAAAVGCAVGYLAGYTGGRFDAYGEIASCRRCPDCPEGDK